MKAKQDTNYGSGGGYMPQMPEDDKRSMSLLILIVGALMVLIAYLIFK